MKRIGERVIKKFRIDLRIRAGYGTAFFLLLISYLLTLFGNYQLIRQVGLVDHSQVVMMHLEQLKNAIADGETGQRGFIITDDERFKQPYLNSRQRTDSVFTLLKNETGDNRLMQENLSTLGIFIDKKFSLMEKGLTLHLDSAKMAEALNVTMYNGKETMDRIRKLCDEMRMEERRLMDVRTEKLNAKYSALNAIVITSLVLAFILVIYGFVTYTRENKARRVADERVEAYQEELRARINELDHANKELIQMRSQEKFASTGRIARTIAHEVRNPLTNINLAVDQLKADIPEEENGITLMLEMISRNSNRINQLITDLLSSTKFIELSHRKESINKILDETIELAKDRIQLKNIRVIRDYTNDMCDVSVDVEKIKIAFLNLVINAIEAMQENSGILKIKSETKNGKCVVTISDNGAGIDKDSISKLFEPYFTSKPKGTGLGLTNTQNIILSHKGYINVESTQGAGTQFYITLNFAS